MRLRTAALVGAWLVLALLTIAALAGPWQPTQILPAIALDSTRASQISDPELNHDNQRLFRWTSGRSTIRLPRQATGDHIIALELESPLDPTRPLVIELNQQPVATLPLQAARRQYQLLVPDRIIGWGSNTLALVRSPSRVSGDTRELGMVLYRVRWLATSDAVRPFLLAIQSIVLLSSSLLLWLALRRQVGDGWSLLVTGAFLAINLLMQASDVRFDRRVAHTLLVAGLAALAALTVWMLRRPIMLHQSDQVRLPLRWLLTGMALSLLLAIILYAPVLPTLNTQLLGPPGDSFEYAWKIGWVAESLVQQRLSPLVQPDFFAPVGFELARSELTPAHTIPGGLLSLLFGPVVAYNLVCMSSFVLAGLFMMHLATRLGSNPPGALVAGLAFAFCSYRIFYAQGTLPMAGSQWIVLAVYGWEGFLRWRRPFDGFLAGLGIALAAWSSWYLGITLPLMLLVYTLLRLAPGELLQLVRSWRALLPGLLTTTMLVAPYLQPYLALSPPPHGRAELLPLSATPLAYLLPNPFQPLWGAALRDFAYQAQANERVSIGLAVLLLAMVGLFQYRHSRIALALIGTALCWFVLSLGPELRVGTQIVLLPVEWIYQHVPGLKNIRVWSRVAIYVQLAMALLAGLAFQSAWLKRPILAALVIGVVVFENISVVPLWSPVAPRPVEQWLASQPERLPVLHIPDTLSGYHEFQTRTTHKPLTAGYGTFYPEYFLPHYFRLQAFPAPKAFTALQVLNPGYLVVNQRMLATSAPDWRDRMAAYSVYTEVYRDSEITVFRNRAYRP